MTNSIVVTNFIGASAAIRELQVDIQDAARSGARVLITGESGVGKEIAARSIHRLSRNAHMPMVTINCAGIPDSLLESELFGHVRGSFTDAYRDHVGLLEQAHGGGTVFLDEVGEMSPRMQALLLRFLENGEIQPVGGVPSVRMCVNVRVVAATNRDLFKCVASHDFRDDLYYRLNVIRIEIPPLRTRREDILVLLRHYFGLFAEQHRVRVPELLPDALENLEAYDWPGNVRQLKNIAERLTVRAQSAPIGTADLPPEIREAAICKTIRLEAPAMPPKATAVESLLEQMTDRHETFWKVVYPLFMARDLTRTDLREIISRGFQQAGNYKVLAELFNVAPGEYRRFLNFLRTHGCDVRFQLFRAVRADRFTVGAGSLVAQASDRPSRNPPAYAPPR